MPKKRFLPLIFCLACSLPAVAEDVGELKREDAQPLMADEVVLLNTTSITGTEEQVLRIAGSAHLLNEELLENFKYDDIHRVLSQVPGVYIREEDGYGLRPNIGFRGADSNRSKKVVLMEDGLLLGPAPYSAPAAYFFPVTSRMTGVEVFKGPSSIQYGPNTIGGAINLQTRPTPDQREGALDVAYGTDQYAKGRLHFGDRLGQWSYVLDGIHLRSDGFKDIDGGGDTGFDKTELMFKLQWETDSAKNIYQRFGLKLGYSDETSNETYIGLRDDDFNENPTRRYTASRNDLIEWDRNQVVLSHLVSFGSSVDISTKFYRHEFARTWAKMNGFAGSSGLIKFLDVFDGTAERSSQLYAIMDGQIDSTGQYPLVYGSNAREYLSQGVQLDGAWYVDSTIEQTLKFGVRFHQDYIERKHDQNNVDIISGQLNDIAGTDIATKRNKDETKAISSYLLHELTWKQLTVAPGVRVESTEMTNNDSLLGTSKERSDVVWLPGLGMSYAFDDEWMALFGVHQGFSPVSPNQDETVQEESSVNYELGFRYHEPDYHFEVIGFFNDYSNLLGTATLSTGATIETLDNQFNGGEVDVYGLEVSSQIKWSSGEHQWPLRLNYTYTQTEFKSTFESSHYGYDRDSSDGVDLALVLEGEALPYVPEHIFQFDLGWHWQNLKVHFNGKYQAEMLELASELKADDFWSFDLSAFYAWTEKRDLYVKVNNVFDENHIVGRRPYGARGSRPRQIQVGAEFFLH